MSYNAIDKYRETITKKKNELENRTYSQKALEALAKGNYASMRNNSKQVPSLKPTQKTNTQAKQTTTTAPKAKVDDRNYVVKRDRYDKLMQDSRLANDIKTLAEVNYKNANQDATVSQEWADTIGAKNITGGYTKQQYLDTLSRRYSLTPKELNDMALTFHSDANKAETEAYGKGLEEAGKKLPVLGSLGSFVGTLGSGVEGAYNTLVGGITGDDRYLSNMFRTTKNSPREGVKQNINSDAGKAVYDIGMGVGDMIASAAAGSAPTLLAGNTANEAQASARERGSSVRKSSAYAGAAGALDFITNKIGLDKAKDLALSSIKSAGLKKLITQGAVAGAGEAGENLIQDIGQSFFDTLINGKNSELLYSFDNKLANGMSGEDALKEVAKEYALQLGVSAATGFGMGAVMQGGRSIMNDPAGFKSELSKLQINNKGMADIDELASKNPDIQAILRSKPLEGAELEEANVRKKDVDTLLRQKNKEIAAQKEAHKNADKKTRDAEYQKLTALQQEAESLRKEKKSIDRAIKGEATPVKEILEQQNKDLYDNIFQRKTGLLDNINYVAKHAGDTAEAKQLAKDVRKAITDYIETGDVNSTLYDRDVIKKINRLDELANTVDAEYIGHFRDNVLFTDEDGNASIWNALEGIGENPGYTSQIGEFHDANIRNTTSAPIETPASSVDPAYQLANDVAASFEEFDPYSAMDDSFEMESFVEQLADDIRNGRDLSGLIENIEDNIDNAADVETRTHMIDLIDRLSKANEGRVETDGQLTPEEITKLNEVIAESEKEKAPVSVDNMAQDAYNNITTGGNINGRQQIPELNRTGNQGSVRPQESNSGRATVGGGVEGKRTYTREDGRTFDLRDVVNDDISRRMDDAGINNFGLRNTTGQNEEFSKQLAEAKASNKNGRMVSSKTPEELQDAILFSNDDRTCGVAIEPDGNIVAVHKNTKNKTKGAVDDMLITARANGGDRLDCYGEGLVKKYETDGFIPVARVEWNEKFKPDDWGDNPPEELYVMMKDSRSTEQVLDDIRRANNKEKKLKLSTKKELDSLPYFTIDKYGDNAYTEALNYRDKLIEQSRNGVASSMSSNDAPRRSFFDDIPPRSDKEGKSKVGTNTMVNAKIFTEDQINNDPVISELNKYAKANNDTIFNQAREDVINDGDTLLDDYLSGRKVIGNDLDVDRAMLLLKGLNDKISYGDTSLEAQRNLLFSKLRQTGTLYGQTIQAFKKWNDTPEGAIINGNSIPDATVERWKTNNVKQTELNGRIAKALEQMGMDNSMRNKPKVEKTHEQIRKGVENVLAREYGSVDKYFNDTDIEFLTTLAENKDIPVWQITDEIEHKMNTGSWYTLDESIPEPQGPINQKLKNALDELVPREKVEKEPLTFNEIREQVKNTLDREMAHVNDFSDRDIDYLANLINEGATKQELTEALNKRMATGKFGIEPDTQRKVVELFEYANRYDPNSKQAIEAKTAAYKLIADEVVPNATPAEKFEAWRYIAMLGNPKTMIRNKVGNETFGAVTGVSNNFAALLEEGTDRLAKRLNGGQGIQRTKAILNPIEDRGLIQAAANDGDAHRYKELSGEKYERGTKDAIRKQKSVFNSKLIQLYERATDRGISDYSAVKKKYSTSLAGYMKANGLDASAFDADEAYRGLRDISKRRVLTADERAKMESYKGIYDQLEKARDYAVKQAEYATFHEDNAFAKWLTKASQSAPGPGRAIIEGLVPFKKTPANILRSGFEFSPLNAIKSIKETGKLIYENTGKRKENLADTYVKTNKITGNEKTVNRTLAADVLDSWSKTLTGSMLVGLGYYLKNKGILNSSNKDEKWQDDLEGKQNYSITINGKTYTLDWAAPAVMPLLLGAEISKVKDRNNLLDQHFYENLDEVVGTVNALLDPIFETSMLQGIKNTVESAANDIKYSEDGAVGGLLGSLAFNMGTSYLTQGLPTVSGQIARTVDNTRRATDTLTQQSFLGSVEKQGRKMMNKIPFLSTLNQPYYDSYGRTQQNGPFNNPIGNLLYQMGSPAYIRDINTTDADKQARDVYYALGAPDEETGKRQPIMDKDVFASWKSTVKDGAHKFTPEEMAIYRKESGQANYAIRDALTKEDWFNNLDGEEQTKYLKKVNTLVDKIGKGEAGYAQDGEDLEAYESGGVPSLLSYWSGKIQSKRVTEETGLSANTNAVKEINQLFSEGQAEEAEKKIKQAKKDNEARMKLNEKYGVNIKMADYQRREEANPGSNEEWAKEHATKGTQTQTTPKVTTKSEPEANNTTVDTAGYEKYINRAGNQSKKFTNDIPKLKELNYKENEMYTYAYAIKQDSNLTPQSFKAQYDKLNLDGKGAATQDEMISYFNQNNTSEKQANYLWRTYGEKKGEPWKTLPVLKNGTWKKSK